MSGLVISNLPYDPSDRADRQSGLFCDLGGGRPVRTKCENLCRFSRDVQGSSHVSMMRFVWIPVKTLRVSSVSQNRYSPTDEHTASQKLYEHRQPANYTG